MEKIIRNGREFIRFKIGDEFTAISGKGSFNKMKKDGLCSDEYNEELGFIYPVYSASVKGNHICGYSLKTNSKAVFQKAPFIKVTTSGEPGKSVYSNKDSFLCEKAYAFKGKYVNEYVSSFLSTEIPKYAIGSAQKNAYFGNYKDECIEIPSNHEELSKIIKRVNEYKQLSKQLSKQMEDYKKAILQESEKAIKYFKESGQHDKYISFKIGDEFEDINGKGSFTELRKIGLSTIKRNIKEGYIYPIYDNSTSKNHIKGYSSEYNNEIEGYKVSLSGASAGSTKYISGKYYLSSNTGVIYSKKYNNEYISLFLNNYIPQYVQGSTIPHAYFSYYKENFIELPKKHKELSEKIKKINQWRIQVNETTEKMEKYIDGILQMSLK